MKKMRQRNLTPGPCWRCGLDVAPKTGWFSKRRLRSDWVFEHSENNKTGMLTCRAAKAAVGQMEMTV